jgi:putative ABC transport system permease protein
VRALPVPLRLALREMRGSLKGFRVFIACLALGVAAIAAVGSVREAVQEGLAREASTILGGDAEIRFTYRFAAPEERAWMDANATAVSEVVDFRSMVTHSPEGDEPERALVQVKGVDANYPLTGRVGLADGAVFPEALGQGGDLPGMVAQRVLADRLGVGVGDVLRLGTRDFRLTAILTVEPDGAASGFGFGPRVIVDRAALGGSGLLTEGSLFETHYRMLLPEGTSLDASRASAEAAMPDSGMRWRDIRRGAPGIDNFVDRLAAFLILMGLAGLAVGGVGVSAAVRAYLEGKTETIATLKTLGATGRTVFAIYLTQIGLLALVGIAIGLAIGAAIPVLIGPLYADRVPVPVAFSVYRAPLLEAATYGLLVALIFTIWPLARARDIRAAALFRDLTAAVRGWPRAPYVALTAGLAALLVATATVFAGNARLALWSAAGIVGALALLFAAALAARAIARRLARSRLSRGRPALRLAFGSVGGPTGETVSVVLSLGLGLAVLATVGQIDANLRALISGDLPERAPAYFFVDIQNDQLEGFVDQARAEPGVEAIDTAPMLRGIITRINGRPAREVAGGHWVLRGDRGVTYAAEMPDDTIVTSGEWWPADYDGPPLMSFSDEVGHELGLALGDEITVNVLGRDITATIANFREVRFQTMGINFVMALDANAMRGAPHTHIATIYADEAAEAPLLRTLAGAYPNVTAVRVREAIARVSEALEGLTAATRWAAAVTLLTGFVVLIGAAAAGVRQRTYESAVLKTLGATRRSILASFALRSAMLGAAGGLVAILAGAIAGWGVTTYVMEAAYRFEPVSALAIVAVGAAASLLAGLAFALGPLAARPARVLRARD